METARRHAGKMAAGSGTLALLASLAGNVMQYDVQQSEGERCQEIVMRQHETLEALLENFARHNDTEIH